MKSITKVLHQSWISSLNKIMIIALGVIFIIISCDKNGDENLISDTGLCLVQIDGNFKEVELDEAPSYIKGGYDGFLHAIAEEVSYPAEARENDIQGICIVNYEITEQGTVENIVATQDPGGGIGESAVETIESVTAGVSFSPGILNGISVRVRKGLELKYKLQ